MFDVSITPLDPDVLFLGGGVPGQLGEVFQRAHVDARGPVHQPGASRAPDYLSLTCTGPVSPSGLQ